MSQRLYNHALVTVTGIAIFGSLILWRRKIQLEQECRKLREALERRRPNRKNKQLTSSSSSLDECDAKEDDKTNQPPPVRSTLMETQPLMEDGLNVKPIGVVRSIYRLCVGTPRQGLLAPNARGCIDLFKLGDSSPVEAVDGLEGYSHIWILFIFHLNTQSKNAARRIKSKITPPALGGQRVGIYATRTPHRYNPIGITLCKLDRIEKLNNREVTLHISGLDLVDGTPVLDIKPFVPVYDSLAPQGSTNDSVKLPDWVEGGLSLKRSVVITDSAKSDLQDILTKNPQALEFYGPKHGQTTVSETLEAALECIQQVLAMDVRSSYQTKKSRSGKFQAERSGRLKGATKETPSQQASTPQSDSQCTQQLDNLLIHYQIKDALSLTRAPSENSGAEDTLIVTSIELLQL